MNAVYWSPSCLAAAAALVLSAATSAQDITVKIGHAAPTSGRMANVGRASENAARMALDELNQKGVVIAGRKARFEFIAEDDEANPEKAVAVARKFVAAGVNGVVGHMTSDTTIAAAKVYSEAAIPQVTPSATSPAFTDQGHKTSFRTIANDTQVAKALGRYAVDVMKARRFAVTHDSSAYGRGAAAEFSRVVAAAGGSVLELPSTTQAATDFSEILEGVRTKSPEVLFFGGLTYQAGPMIAQMKKLGLPAKFMGADGVCQDNLMSRWAAISVTEGEVVCASPGSTPAVAGAAEKFRAAYHERFGSQAQYYEAQAYDAVMVMADAMARAGSPEPTKYLASLASTDGYKGITGNIAFDARGDLRQAPLSIHTYKGQEKKSVVGIAP